MPNTSVPATGEAMPAGAADPLLDAINAYRAGLIEFNRLADNSPDDSRWKELGAATYEPWQAILDSWDQPARTCEGALEALRASLAAEDGVYGTEAAGRMVRAALAYFEGRAVKMNATNPNLIGVIDLLHTIQKLNFALFMAAGDSGLTSDAAGAVQALSMVIDDKVSVVTVQIEEAMGDLQ